MKTSGEKRPSKTAEIELHPDAWDRFTDFVKRIAKAGPQHRVKKESERLRKAASRKGRAT
jgi:hypothetical protein